MAAPQGLVCLMMATGGLFKFLNQLPAGVEIDQVVVAELLAVQLAGPGDAGSGTVGVERGALMRIFAVAQRHGLRHRRRAALRGMGRRRRMNCAGASAGSELAMVSRVLAMAESYAAVMAKAAWARRQRVSWVSAPCCR